MAKNVTKRTKLDVAETLDELCKADEELKDVRGWLCDNLSNGDAGKMYSMCRMLYVVSRHANELEEENDKLRVERDHWHVEQVHAYGNWEDAHKRASELEAENAKLRELVKSLWFAAQYLGMSSNGATGSGFARQMRELGIEVGCE